MAGDLKYLHHVKSHPASPGPGGAHRGQFGSSSVDKRNHKIYIAQDGSSGKNICCEAWRPEFKSLAPA